MVELSSGSVLAATKLSFDVIIVAVLLLFLVGSVRLAFAVKNVRARWRVVQIGRPGGSARVTRAATSSTWWTSQRERQRMWRSITRAEQAVDAAASAGMSIGDLRALTRQLHASAETIDSALAPGAIGGAAGRALLSQARAVTQAADNITSTVGGNIVGDTQPRLDQVVDAIKVELEAVRHGRRVSSRR